MKIAVVGSGYVGLVSGACFADFGHDVVCIDKDQSKIDRLHDGIMPIYEPGLDALVESNVKAGRLTFTTDLADGIKGADAVFIAVGTPSRRGDGHGLLTSSSAHGRSVRVGGRVQYTRTGTREVCSSRRGATGRNGVRDPLSHSASAVLETRARGQEIPT